MKDKRKQFFIKNRKGFLLAEETLKIILAVIAIVFLAYLLFSIYNANKDAKDLELAEESLNFLIQEINAERTEVQIYNPKGWEIYSWPNTYTKGILLWKTTEEGMPMSCSNLGWESCICICKKDTPEKCDSKGVCLDNPSAFSVEESIKIKDPPITLSIDYQNKIISEK
jgi:type II secretory pathway pseudopilin PulG